MFFQKSHATYLSPEILEMGHRRAHRLRSSAFTGFLKKAVNHDYDALKAIDEAR